MRCEICSSPTVSWVTVDGYTFERCPACKYTFLPTVYSRDHALTIFNDRYFTDGGAGYPDYVCDEEIRRDNASHYVEIVSRHCPPGSVLDIGAAAGFLLREFINRGWSGIGLEPNASMARYASTHLGVDVDIGTLEDHNFRRTFDLVTMIQVIMHLYDVRRGLEVAARATAPGGYWLIEAPNAASLTARLLGRHWQEYTPPSVLRLFTPDNLRELVADYGFVPVALGRPQKVVSWGHAQSLLAYKARAFHKAPRQLLLRASHLLPEAMHVRYHAEDLFWALYRKNA